MLSGFLLDGQGPCQKVGLDMFQIDKCVPCPNSIISSPSLLLNCLPFLNHFTPGMGRHSWATADQLAFLLSYVPELPKAKNGGG